MNELYNRALCATNKLNDVKIRHRYHVDIQIIDNVSYKTIDNPMPPADGYKEYNDSIGWGGKVDSHAWFKISYNSKRFESEELRFYLSDCSLCDSLLNPQFLIYQSNNIVAGFDMWHKELPISSENGTIYVYAYTGMIPHTRLNIKSEIISVSKDIEELYFDMKNILELSNIYQGYEKDEAIEQLNNAIDLIDFNETESDLFIAGIKKAKKYIENVFFNSNIANRFSLYCVGHTHIDVAWLWTAKQTREKVQRSFSTALNLMDKYDNYTFMSSQPLLYEYVKEEAPQLYEKIKMRVKEGRWSPEGAMWVESDCNITEGESLIRQIYYGKKFFKEEFGIDSKIAWLPDTFGYHSSIPQIFKKSGVEWFVSSKISWNDTNCFPYDLFLWEGIDGSIIKSYALTAQDYNDGKPTRFTTYNSYASPNQIMGSLNRFREKNISNIVLFNYGYGDGGGGPTFEQVENIKRLEKISTNFPITRFKTLNEFFDDLDKNIENKVLPIYRGDYYLEYHRGTYTSVSRIKKENRKISFKISNVEFLGSIVKAILKKPYDFNAMDNIWKLYMQNQFHDILSGTCIKEAYDECDLANAQINKELNLLETKYIKDISNATKGGKYIIINPNSNVVSSCVRIDDSFFYVENINGKGYKILNELTHLNEVKACFDYVENKYLKVAFNKDYSISSIYDKVNNIEYNPNGYSLGVFEIFDEELEYEYQAWELKDYYNRKRKIISDVSNVEIYDKGDIKGVTVFRKYNNTTIKETICLEPSSRLIRFNCTADYRETNTLLKVNFPIKLNADYATCDIQFGTEKEPITKNTSFEKAKFEVCAHKFADISQTDKGYALINDSKYGYDFTDGSLRLSLIKTSNYPYENNDITNHEFNFAFYPHKGHYINSDVMNESYLFNNPLFGVKLNNNIKVQEPNDFSLVNTSCKEIIIETVKPIEDGIIIRMYESTNSSIITDINFGIIVQKAYLVDLCDNVIEEVEINNNKIKLSFNPFEILTIKIEV